MIWEKPISRNLRDTLTLAEASSVLEEIKRKRWWQGSVIPSSDAVVRLRKQPDYWVIASQACNIYNDDFAKVPLIELVGGKHVASRNPAFAKGENPRLLHVLAVSDMQGVSIELDIMTRQWISRSKLAKIAESPLRLRKTDTDNPKGGIVDWNDLFATWLSRSYTRVALPDAFNDAISKSKINKIIDSQLVKRSQDIYGIYFSVNSDVEFPPDAPLGEMPPPYSLGIVLIVEEHADGEELKKKFITQLFEASQDDPTTPGGKVSRAELAKRLGIRVIKEGIEARSITEVTLHELKDLIRFSMSDHLSDSSGLAQ